MRRGITGCTTPLVTPVNGFGGARCCGGDDCVDCGTLLGTATPPYDADADDDGGDDDSGVFTLTN
jgi:hypothetical protein